MPAFGFTPETGTYVGLVTLGTFHAGSDSLNRLSFTKAEFNYTWKKQYIIDLGWEIYTPGEHRYTRGRLTFTDYPDLYYGRGEDNGLTDEISYSSRRTTGEACWLFSLGDDLFTGVVLRAQQYSGIHGEKTGRYGELRPSATAGLGWRLLRDRRDRPLNPGKGMYLEGTLSGNIWESNQYIKAGLDWRKYHTWQEKHTLALRVLTWITLGPAPFYDLSLLGGDSQVRGYYTGRYRENNLISLQTEYRGVIWRRWGWACFGGLSKLNHSLGKLDRDYLRPNYGGGLRFLIDRNEKINLRIDYARGTRGSDGFYISFGEAF